jgi:hypothetical protein
VDDDVRYVEIENAIANDPSKAKKAAVLTQADSQQSIANALKRGRHVDIRPSHELPKFNELGRSDRSFNEDNSVHSILRRKAVAEPQFLRSGFNDRAAETQPKVSGL